MGLALSLSKYLALSTLRFSEKLIIIGLPVGISSLFISISDILNCIDTANTPYSSSNNSLLVHKIVKSIKYSSDNNNLRVCLDD